MNRGYLEAVRERVVIYDGAFGTYVQQCGLTADDFGGPALEGCNELLVATRPDVITSMHEAFLRIGVDAVETASFGSMAFTLAEYGIAERSEELNETSARSRASWPPSSSSCTCSSRTTSSPRWWWAGRSTCRRRRP